MYLTIFILNDLSSNNTVIVSLYHTAIKCPTLTSPSNGMIQFSDSSASPGFLTTATYSCATGYGLSGGDEVRTCVAAGTGTGGDWSGVPPSCEGTSFMCVIGFVERDQHICMIAHLEIVKTFVSRLCGNMLQRATFSLGMY